MAQLSRPLLITVLVLTEVGMWQWRMVIAARGRRLGAVLLGAAGAVLQITAITQVVANVGDPLSTGAYAAGVGIGVLAGLAAGERLTPGMLAVTITTTAPDAAAWMWARGWPAIVTAGRDPSGPVTVLFVQIDRRHEARLYHDVVRLAPGAGWSSGELRQRPGQLAPASATQPQPAPPPAVTRTGPPGHSRREGARLKQSVTPARPAATMIPPTASSPRQRTVASNSAMRRSFAIRDNRA